VIVSSMHSDYAKYNDVMTNIMLLNSSVKHCCWFVVWPYLMNVVVEQMTPVIADCECSQNIMV
jgi:hypothetical protein